jgi:hypothetical protein
MSKFIFYYQTQHYNFHKPYTLYGACGSVVVQALCYGRPWAQDQMMWMIFFNLSDLSWPPLWSSGQSSWPQIQRSGSIPGATRFLRSNGSGTGSTQPREYNVLERKRGGSSLDSRELGRGDVALTTRHPQSAKLALTSPTSGCRPV